MRENTHQKNSECEPFSRNDCLQWFLVSQEIHPTVNDYIKWEDDFKDGVVYSHGKCNSFVVLICFIHSKRCFVRNKLSGNDGHILILDVDIDDENFILTK